MNLQIQDTFTKKLPADPDRNNTRRQVLKSCFSYVNPKKPSNPKLLHVSKEMAASLGFNEEDIQLQDFLEMVTGAPSSELVNSVLRAIGDKKLDDALGAVGKAVAQNIDTATFLKLLLHKMRLVLLLRYAKEMEADIKKEISTEDFKFLKSLAKEGAVSGVNSGALSHLLEAYSQVGYSYITQLPLELALIKIIGQNN